METIKLVTPKEQKTKELLKFFKNILKTRMDFYKHTGGNWEEYYKKISIFTNEIYITLLHILHNRIRRNDIRPHLGTVEKETEYMNKNSYELNKIKKLVEEMELGEALL